MLSLNLPSPPGTTKNMTRTRTRTNTRATTRIMRDNLLFRHKLVVSLVLLFLSTGLPSAVLGWSSNGPNTKTTTTTTTTTTTSTRRQWMKQILLVASGGAAAVTASPSVSNAACLPGDLSSDCIGVYKVPIDDAILPYVGTPDALKKFAPDLKYVPPIASPNSYDQAWEILQTQRIAADDIKQVVSAGRLEEAGIKVLNLVPKVTSSGRVVLNTIESEIVGKGSNGVIVELQINKLQDQFNTVLALWGECDVMIGQGLRGEMGVSAAAQLQILSSLQDATAALDDFLTCSSSTRKPKNG